MKQFGMDPNVVGTVSFIESMEQAEIRYDARRLASMT